MRLRGLIGLIGIAFLVMGQAQAQSPDAASAPANGGLGGLYACTQIADNGARLTCFDAAAAQLRAAEAGGQVRIIDQIAAEQIDRDSFGFSLPSLSKILAPNKSAGTLGSSPIDRISSIIQSVRTSPSGQAVITLENGQVWRQIDQESAHPVKVGRSVEISKASFGSFFLTVKPSGTFRVRREQ